MRTLLLTSAALMLLACADEKPGDSGALPTDSPGPEESGLPGDSSHSETPDSADSLPVDDSAPPEDTATPQVAEIFDLGGAHARLLGQDTGDELGRDLALVGDVDGDGQEDLLVSTSIPGVVDEAGTLLLLQGPFAGELTSADAVAVLRGLYRDSGVGELCPAGDMDDQQANKQLILLLNDEISFLRYLIISKDKKIE